MKEQPQKPEESQEQQDNLASAINKLAKSRTAWMLYAQSLERENTAIKEQNMAMKREINQYAEWAKCDIPYPEVK